MWQTIANTEKKSWLATFIFLLLIIAICLPRILSLTTFVTIDERLWLTRSANFYHALAKGDFAQTYQKEHPGVTVMWLGSAGFLWRYPAYVDEVPGQLGWMQEEIEPFLHAHGYNPLDLLAAGRFFVVLTITIVLSAAFLVARRLVGFFPALVGFLLIAFNPFHVALSRFLHLDALLSSFMFLSLLTFLTYLKTGHRGALVLSAIAGGLACLTKSPGLFLGPFFVLLVLLNGWQAWREKRAEGWQKEFSKGIKTLFLWGIGVIIVFVLFWPAMWVNPVGTIEQILAEALLHAVEGHPIPLYFLSEVIANGDPGPYFYPITYLWRTTPVVLIGLLLAIRHYARRGQRPINPQQQLVMALLLFAIGYTLFMTGPAKKFDRYLLPIYMPLDLVAGMGWVATAHALRERLKGRLTTRLTTRLIQPALLGMIILLQSLFTLNSFPYYLNYYNPLLGGLARAQQTMTVGWGEGLDLAADYLNNKPNAEELQVIASYWSGPFSYFFKGKITQLDDFYNQVERWLNSDYLVVYVNQWQRKIPSPETIAYLNEQTPEKVIEIDGVEYARIYNMQTLDSFDGLLTGRPKETYACEENSDLNWSHTIQLLAHDLPKQPVQPGERFQATFNLQSAAPIDRNLNVLVRLVGPSGEIMRDDGWPWGTPTSTWQPCDIWPDGHDLTIPEDLPPGYYRIELGFYDSTRLISLPAYDSNSGEPIGENLIIDYFAVGELPNIGNGTEVQSATLGEQIKLLRVERHTPDGQPIHDTEQPIRLGETLHLRLFWQAERPIQTDYTVFVHLIAPDGQLILQRDQQPQNGFFPTSFWKAEWIISDDYELPIAPDAPTGAYKLHIGMYDLQTGQRLPVTRDGQASGVVEDYLIVEGILVE